MLEKRKLVPIDNLTERNMKLIRNTSDMHRSLILSVEEAGGSAASFSTWQLLEEMSVAELLILLGINNIRFVFIGGKDGNTD
jgi:hypothetical protein